MQETRIIAPDGVVSEDGADPSSIAPGDADELRRLISASRQAFLDALHIAAAVVVLERGTARVADRNRAFDRLGQSCPHMTRILVAATTYLLDGGREEDTVELHDSAIGGRHFRLHFSPLPAVSPHESRAMLSVVDRTAEVETERSLRAEMLHDSLTGLPNRMAFLEAIDTAIVADPNAFAVLAIDLARFSRINECVGALVGDELIITVARRLKSVLRPGDMLARMAGDEFGVLLALADGPGDALHAARRVQLALAGHIRLSELDIRVDCAIGCALCGDTATTATDMLRNAQVALKRAKASRRVEVYRPGEIAKVRRRFSLETDLRRAIESEQLTLAFQPLVRLESGCTAGFEALARWNHPQEGPIPPSEFIAVAEDSGLIVPLGRWALDSALRTLAAWDREAGVVLPVYVAVNVAPAQLSQDSIAGMAAESLRRHGVSGKRLTLELTESSIVADPDHAKRVLDALQGLGCRVAMDDFGTGYSSLSSLQKLPIDILKIDRSLVTGMLDDKDATAIVRAILSLADALGMTTTAEGIETLETARVLTAIGCHTGQGYHYARPLAPDEALAHYLSSRGCR